MQADIFPTKMERVLMYKPIVLSETLGYCSCNVSLLYKTACGIVTAKITDGMDYYAT